MAQEPNTHMRPEMIEELFSICRIPVARADEDGSECGWDIGHSTANRLYRPATGAASSQSLPEDQSSRQGGVVACKSKLERGSSRDYAKGGGLWHKRPGEPSSVSPLPRC